MMARRRAATPSIASSQPMRSKPPAAVRCSGWSRRSGSRWTSRLAMPLWQAKPRVTGCSRSGRSARSAPSSTSATSPQAGSQTRQKVGRKVRDIGRQHIEGGGARLAGAPYAPGPGGRLRKRIPSPRRRAVALRRFLLAIGALLLLGSACRAPGETWILAGQSNAAGYSLWYDAPVPLPTPSGLTARALKGWGEVGLAVDPLRAPGDPRRSPWPQFAAERLARGYARPHLVQTAEPGTCLAIGAYGQKARWDPEEGDLYARMLERAAAARRAGFPRPVAVLWHQGECEAALGLPAPVVRPLYRDALMR